MTSVEGTSPSAAETEKKRAEDVKAETAQKELRAKRQAIRDEMAVQAVAEARRLELKEEIYQHELRGGELAGVHIATCEPWQTELAAIEEQQVAAILAKQPADKAKSERRRELLTLINSANAAYEKTSEAHAAELGLLKKAKTQAAKDAFNVGLMENQLWALAPVEQHIQHRAIHAEVQVLERHVSNLEDVLETWQRPEMRERDEREFTVKTTTAKLERARADLARLLKEMNDIYRAAIDAE